MLRSPGDPGAADTVQEENSSTEEADGGLPQVEAVPLD